ncbi:carbon catabolite repressor protein 4-like 4 [Melia azedarach]|uniref:Carbon catabolite repressor protein 4-like 4 n=1 Tax=Melia azedarach TaxID=155640 RepID=A0ACC1Z042_MELAZ|nr:carbon catabolite repressor protein 4-like 4 [Melia azedarach]
MRTFTKEIWQTDGYSSIYIQRSGQKRDGCGIFYKHNCAELLVEERIEYNDLVNSIQDGSSCGGNQKNMLAKGNDNAESKNGSSLKKGDSGDHGDLNDPYVRLKRDCVGIMTAFRLKGPFDHVVVVATTHLYWDPELADVKLAQAKYLASRLAEFKTQISDKFDCVPSVIVAGDFNSVPGDKVYQYLTSRCPTSAPLVAMH